MTMKAALADNALRTHRHFPAAFAARKNSLVPTEPYFMYHLCRRLCYAVRWQHIGLSGHS